MYSRELIERVVRETDIVSVISEYVELKKAGKNYKALCPFHQEKTPSFMVSPEKQLFHCFGCGKGGNVITFVKEIENISFYDAVKRLADRLGIHVDEGDMEEFNRKERSRKRLYKINEKCARIFYELLLRNQRALSYLEGRGVSLALIKKFMLGWASKKELVIDILSKSGFSVEEMIESGIFGRGSDGSLFLRFNNRLIFPIMTASGEVAGFGGRVIDDVQGVAKYINTPETEIFSKRKELYGLNLAMPVIKRGRKAVIVEGYMDTIALHKNGIEYAVASLGTSLTGEQVRKLVGVADTVFIAYDSDIAGEMATFRALQLLMGKGISVKIIRIPDGKDPDEFFKNHTTDDWHLLEEEAISMFEYAMDIILRQKKDDESNIRKVAEDVVNFLSGFDEIYQDRLLPKAAVKLGLNESTLRKLIYRRRNKRGQKIGTEDMDVLLRKKEDKYTKAELELLWLALTNIQVRGILKDVDIASLFRRQDTFSIVSYVVNEGIWMSEGEIIEALRSTQLSSLLSQFVWRRPLQESINAVKLAEELIDTLREREKEERLREIGKSIESGNASLDLLKEYVELRRSIRR